MLTAASVGGVPTARAGFGTAVRAVDLDLDGFTDLVVGAPGASRTGRAWVVYGADGSLGGWISTGLASHSR